MRTFTYIYHINWLAKFLNHQPYYQPPFFRRLRAENSNRGGFQWWTPNFCSNNFLLTAPKTFPTVVCEVYRFLEFDHGSTLRWMIRLSNLHVWILRGKRFVGKKGGENRRGWEVFKVNFSQGFLITLSKGCLAESFKGWWINGSCSGKAWKVTTHRKTLSLERSNKESITLWIFMMWSAIDYILINIYYIDKIWSYIRWFEQRHSKHGFWDE